jgi:hypothetical protein
MITGPQRAGMLAFPPRNEASGLAASRRTPDTLWLHDDSGSEPFLYAVGTDGASRGKLQIGGMKKAGDWEDVAAVQLDSRPYLVIGDIGDNDAKRRAVTLLLIPEPEPKAYAGVIQSAERPAATLILRYEEGPRDCEALAVDATSRTVFLLTKRDPVPRLYSAELPPGAPRDGELRARFVGLVPHVPQPTAAQKLLKGHLGQQRARPTAMDFASDGSAAVVLTYGDVLYFPRRAGEPWAEALARPPQVLAPHGLPQAEAACFSADARAIYVASERSRTLVRYDLPRE